jgi:hypothetical protein
MDDVNERTRVILGLLALTTIAVAAWIILRPLY